MSDLFTSAGLEAPLRDADARRPLADLLRPRTLAEVVGQDHLLGPEGALRRMIAAGRLGSLVLWGPPGVGKTTIARLLAAETDLHFAAISAIFSGVKELRAVFEAAEARRRTGRGTLLFVDEIHRFNRSQQDGFLPYVERGIVTLVGATTENPSFELNAALLSRARVFVLLALDAVALEALLVRAETHVGHALPLTPEARATLCDLAQGDGRYLLNLVEALLADAPPAALDRTALAARLERRAPVYDKDRDGHFDLISALHKSVRASDVDAALYWLARMLAAGEQPLYLARRLVRMAVEDIGLADPTALTAALAAKDAYDFLGSPEGELALAQACVHLAAAPKSNRVYVAWKAALRSAKETGHLPPPKVFRNAPTALMKAEGYGAGYVYDPDAPEGFSGQSGFPDDLSRQSYYTPTRNGAEAAIAERLARWAKLRGERESHP